jgi:hypothetical protein
VHDAPAHTLSKQTWAAQSAPAQHAWPLAHPGHEPPPQSTSLSKPSRRPSVHVAGEQSPLVFTTRGPKVAFPVGPSPAQLVATTKYQYSPPGAGTCVSTGPVLVPAKVAKTHESTVAFARAARSAAVPRTTR